MQLELGLQLKRSPVLRIAASADAAWDGGIAEWFAAVRDTAWRAELPAIVVVPTRGHAQGLRSRLVASGKSALGVQFITPPYLRALLHPFHECRLASPDDLRLLLAVAAEEHLTSASSEAEQFAATSIRRTPDHLLRLLDQLEAAGWSLDAVELPAFRPVIARFRTQLAGCGFQISAEADRAALASANAQPRCLSNLLISGFHGAHWPLWHLLRAAVAAAEEATVSLQYPREEAAELDTAWIGSWEEAFGEATVAASTAPAEEPERECLFLVGMDAQEQAHAISAAALRFLADERCSRLAIVFPAAGALARLVGASLTRSGIPHQDAMGQRLPGIFETASFTAWMELQRTPRLNALVRFLHSLDLDHPLFMNIARDRAEKVLRNALSEIAIDDLTVLAAGCGARAGEGEFVRDLIHAIKFLPDRGTLAEFLGATSAAFEHLQWHERWREIESRTGWAESLPASFSRTLYLRWLSDSASTVRITRDATGSHPYARVQILTAAQAEDQSWSHLILAGLNEGAWPAGGRGDFLPTEQIDAFNSSVQKLNRAATRRGRQGEGHVAVHEGKSLFLGTPQQRQLARAQFDSLIESASHSLALTASLVQEAIPERISNPSEFFGRVYYEAHGQPVSQAAMRTLRDETRRWLDSASWEPRPEHPETPGILQTRVAYSARREIAESGEYDFALRDPPNEIKPLSVSNAETMLKSPALIWVERYLGVEGAEDSTYVWNATVGKWTHEWLASILGRTENFTPFPAPADIAPRILAAAERKRAEVRKLCRQAGKVVPDWWGSGWENALCLAQTLGRILGTIDGWKFAVTEWRLETQPIAVGDGRSLLLRGRADLLLAKTATPPASLAVPDLWIIDFKTGNKKSLAPSTRKKDEPRAPRVRKQVLKGEALQLALYALAAKQLGAQSVDVSILSPVIAKPEAQLHDDDFSECTAAFSELAWMQTTGIFGMRGLLRDAFTFTKDYPLATLAIDSEIIDERWELTHPDLAVEEESWT